MKKVLFAVVALALSAGALADAGVYVQGDLGVSRVGVSEDDGEKSSKSGFSPRLSVGYDFGNNIRAALDYTHYKGEKYTEQYIDGPVSGKTKLNSIGVSVFYDFPVHEQVKPYVGARMGFNRFSGEIVNNYGSEKYSATKTGLGVILGVGYNVTENVALDAGYRYNHWGKYDDDYGSFKLHSHELSAGVRVKF